MHATVGVAIKALKRAGNWIADESIDFYPGVATAKDASSLMLDSDLFSLIILNLDMRGEEGKRAWDEIENFVYLAFGQVRAIDRAERADTVVKGGGTKKNYTPFLSRSNFYSVFRELCPRAQAFLVDHKEALKTILEKGLHDRDEVGHAHTYLDEIFDQKVNMTQKDYFGGMVVRPPEDTGMLNDEPQRGVPVEVRGMGLDLSEEGVREKMGELFVASRSQFTDETPYSPFALSVDYLLEHNRKKKGEKD